MYEFSHIDPETGMAAYVDHTQANVTIIPARERHHAEELCHALEHFSIQGA